MGSRGLCRIHEVHIKKEEIFERKSTGFFSSEKVYTGRFKETVESVSIEQLGNDTGLVYTYNNPKVIDWKDMRLAAIRIVSQIKYLDGK